jgi:hypothetical protein
MHQGMCDRLAFATADELDLVTSVDVQLHNVMAVADSMDWEFDLKDMWLTKSRWTMMQRQYLDAVTLIEWLNRSAQLIGTKGRGVSLMRTNIVKPRGGRHQGNKESRRWGSCMIAISYKAVPKPQITLYSRTSYMGYLAAMDISIAWMCGRYIAAMTGQKVEDFRFLWYNECAQYHMFKSMAYFLNHPDPDKQDLYHHLLLDRHPKKKYQKLIDEYPAIQYSRVWMQRSLDEDEDGHTLGDINYNTYRRIKRRFHTEILGYEHAQKFEGWSLHRSGPNLGEQKEFFKAYLPLPNVPIQTLNFVPLGLPAVDSLDEVTYDAKAAAKAEEDDDEE